MKICEIIDEYASDLLIGYLFYYEKGDVYSVELNDAVPERDMPLFLSMFAKRKIYTLSPEWSRRWVESRVIPRDRQNIGMILKNSGLKTYDAFKLLMIVGGRCAQDDCAVKPIRYEDIPGWAVERRKRKLDFAARIDSWKMLLTFRDGSVYKTDLEALSWSDPHVTSALANPSMKKAYRLMAGGVGIMIGGAVVITAEELYGKGDRIPLTANELKTAAKAYIMDTKDVCDELHCSRQYVSQLTKDNSLSVLKDSGTRLYARSDVSKITE